MKNLKNALKMLPVLLLIVLVSCKKKEVKPEEEVEVTTPPATSVTAKELLDYYIVVEHKTGESRLMVAYFELDKGAVIARVLRQPGYLRPRSVVVEDGHFSIDWNGDGRTSLYHFTIEKDASGRLKLKTYDFEFNGQANQLTYGILAKRTEALPFADNQFIQFKMIRDNVSFDEVKNGIPFKFDMNIRNERIIFWPRRVDPYDYDIYYPLINIGFTTNANYFAVTVPYWKAINTPIMLIEMEDLLFIAAKQ